MKKVIMCLTVIVILLSHDPVNSMNESSGDPYVVIISIDGFPAWYLWDEEIPLPNIRKLARNGVYAEAMIPSNPSNTWSNHTTMVTGVYPQKHGVLHNGKLIRGGPGEPVYVDREKTRYELVYTPTLYEAAYENGLRTADINWPCTRDATSLHDRFPDTPFSVRHMSPKLRGELMKMGLLNEDDRERAGLGRTGAGRAFLRSAAALQVIEHRTPNLILIHLTFVDTIHHNYGVDSDAGHTAIALADRHIGDFLEALENAGVRDNTSIFIVSDHGFKNIDRQIAPNVLLRQNGLLKTDDEGNISRARIQVISTGGTAMVFATDPATRDEDLQTARDLFEQVHGIDRILTPDEYAEYGLPLPDENEQMGDLFLSAGEGHAFHNRATGDDVITNARRGYHGFLNDNPKMETVFIASGRNIPGGQTLGTVDVRSLAPTAARLLGVPFETADLPPLDEILDF